MLVFCLTIQLRTTYLATRPNTPTSKHVVLVLRFFFQNNSQQLVLP